MALKIPCAAELAQRWTQGSEMAVRAALEKPRDQKHYAWALAFAAGNLGKVSKSAGQQGRENLPHAFMQAAGIKVGDCLIRFPLPEGGYLARRATEEDIAAIREFYTDAPAPKFPSAHSTPQLEHHEKSCEGCGRIYCASHTRRRFCDLCQRHRQRAQQREWWHRSGKQTPSYQRKLRVRVPAKEIPAPAVA